MLPLSLSRQRETGVSLGKPSEAVKTISTAACIICVPTAFLALPNFYSCFYHLRDLNLVSAYTCTPRLPKGQVALEGKSVYCKSKCDRFIHQRTKIGCRRTNFKDAVDYLCSRALTETNLGKQKQGCFVSEMT